MRLIHDYFFIIEIINLKIYRKQNYKFNHANVGTETN